MEFIEGSLGVYPEPKGREGVEPISKAKIPQKTRIFSKS
jgi:hypothetical protein